MNGPFRLFLLVAVSSFMAVAASPAFSAQDDALEPIGTYGVVDWVGQRISATGVGVARKGDAPAKARILAERAAATVARRNLLEAVSGVHIDSKTTVEKFMVADDTIEARVAGVVKYAQIDKVEHFADGTVETTVSMPLTGSLGAILIEAAAGTKAGAPLERRVEHLEERVRDLEEKIAGMNQAALEQRQTMVLLGRIVASWTAHGAARPRFAAAATADIGDLELRLQAQEQRLQQIVERIDGIDRQLAGAGRRAPQESSSPYTGLVVDARGTGFKPCLKPEIYSRGALLYPNATVNLQTAIRSGYVRYYRQIDRAQQSERAGSLPLTVRASATYGGQRGLVLEADALDPLAKLAEDPQGFLADCRVVIVF